MFKSFKFFLTLILSTVFLIQVEASPKPNTQLSKKATHLLNRMTFGPTPDQIRQLAMKGEVGLQAWIEIQLNPKQLSDSKVEAKLKNLPTLSMTNQQLFQNYPRVSKKGKSKNFEDQPKQILAELVAQKLIRATESERQFQEVLVDFWFNHFNVDFNKGQGKWLITSYERDAIRPYVFGKFSDLLKATAKHPAMLFYLDNAHSVKEGLGANPKNKKKTKIKSKGLNENYARELMELHTLGVEGGYTQKDVVEVARILTGWSIDRKNEAGVYQFKAFTHDKGPKKVLGVNFPAGGGEEEGVKLLEMLAKHPATAKHLSTKLVKRFISDNPNAETVDRIAKIFLSSNGDLTEVYREIFKSPDFWTEKNYASKIKKPFHLIASMVRSLKGNIDLDESRAFRRLDYRLEQLGEPVYRCQPPTGFKDGAEFWVNSGALVNRIQTALAISHQRIPVIDYETQYFRSGLRMAKVMGDNKEALKYLDAKLLGEVLKESTLEKIAAELNAVPPVQDEIDAQNMEKKKTQAAKTSVNVAQLLGLLLGSPEFQRF